MHSAGARRNLIRGACSRWRILRPSPPTGASYGRLAVRSGLTLTINSAALPSVSEAVTGGPFANVSPHGVLEHPNIRQVRGPVVLGSPVSMRPGDEEPLTYRERRDFDRICSSIFADRDGTERAVTARS